MNAVTLLCTADDAFAFETYEQDTELTEKQLKYDVVRAAAIVRRLDRGPRTTFIVHQGA